MAAGGGSERERENEEESEKNRLRREECKEKLIKGRRIRSKAIRKKERGQESDLRGMWKKRDNGGRKEGKKGKK